MQHFLSVDQLNEEEIYHLIELAKQCQQGIKQVKKPIFALNLFFEPSTRTKMSFTVAQKKLGLEVLDFNPDSSSVQKGESLYDTVKTLESIGADLLVIRHPDDDWAKQLGRNLSIPIINAGAGKLEHPSQCMLDLFTIYHEFNTFKDIRVTIVGDIKHSRVAHSNARALQRLGANISLCAAPEFKDTNLDFPYVSIDEAVEQSDVLMLLRIQHERHHEMNTTTNYLSTYGLTKERERKMKEKAIIMHPAPINRGVEIDEDLVECNRSRIFKQMENGVYMRMAIIQLLLKKWGIYDEDTI